jgi:hypothetical protein
MSRTKGAVKKALPSWLLTVRRYRSRHGRFPNIIRPRTFNEKVLYRILFDRRNALTLVADKFAARSYVEARLGPSILPQLYHVTTDPDTIPFDSLPEKFVVKPSHGSGWSQIVTDKSTLDRAALVKTCRNWLKQSYYEITGEWAYKDIVPRIVVEQFIDDGTGNAPNDYKVYVFGGTIEMIQVDKNRFAAHRRRLYSPNWEKLPALYELDDINGDVLRPMHLAEMITAAEALGRGWDFIRADFYDIPERLYFGEFTTTPGCGMDRFRPAEYDRYLGRRWDRSTSFQRVIAAMTLGSGAS